jgi:phosphatidylglycerophosphate synthase
MLDPLMRRLIDPPLDRVGRRLVAAGISANAVTVVGFGVGALAIPCLAAQWYGAALAAILVNRLADGLDGAVARHTTLSDFGGYLDIVCDSSSMPAWPSASPWRGRRTPCRPRS